MEAPWPLQSQPSRRCLASNRSYTRRKYFGSSDHVSRGDRNTAFFHRTASCHKSSNRITEQVDSKMGDKQQSVVLPVRSSKHYCFKAKKGGQCMASFSWGQTKKKKTVWFRSRMGLPVFWLVGARPSRLFEGLFWINLNEIAVKSENWWWRASILNIFVVCVPEGLWNSRIWGGKDLLEAVSGAVPIPLFKLVQEFLLFGRARPERGRSKHQPRKKEFFHGALLPRGCRLKGGSVRNRSLISGFQGGA